VRSQLQKFLDEHNMIPPHQSAYKKFHSNETALLRLYNDLLVATYRGQVSGLCLLDLTAAFDTVDHDLLYIATTRQHVWGQGSGQRLVQV